MFRTTKQLLYEAFDLIQSTLLLCRKSDNFVLTCKEVT